MLLGTKLSSYSCWWLNTVRYNGNVEIVYIVSGLSKDFVLKYYDTAVRLSYSWWIVKHSPVFFLTIIKRCGYVIVVVVVDDVIILLMMILMMFMMIMIMIMFMMTMTIMTTMMAMMIDMWKALDVPDRHLFRKFKLKIIVIHTFSHSTFGKNQV